MTNSVSLSELTRRGVELTAHEAVAIAQQLIVSTADSEVVRPSGPPTLETVCIDADGSVVARATAVTPVVSEIAALLDAMLPRGAAPVPGGLRYAIARALLEVDSPPFDSIHALAAALARFEKGDRRDVIRTLFARAARPAAAPAPLRIVPPPSVPLPVVPHQAPAVSGSRRRRSHASLVAGGAAAAVLASFGVGWVVGSGGTVRRVDAPAPRASAVLPPLQAGTDPDTDTAPAVNRPKETPGPAAASSPADIAVQTARLSTVQEMYSPAFSADGTTVYFHTGGSRAPRSAIMKRVAVGDDRQLATILDDGARNYHVQPSPDGTLIAFDSDRDGVRGVYIAQANGAGARRVTGPGHAAIPTWSPDGTRLAVVRAEPANPKVWNLWLLTISTGELRRLTRFTYGQTWGASWLPDGTRVCFSHEDQLIVLSLDEGSVRRYQTPVHGRLVRTPAVAPDGNRVIFQVWRDGAWLLDLSTGEMRRVLRDPSAEEFAWSPDGHRVAYHSRSGGRWAIELIAPT